MTQSQLILNSTLGQVWTPENIALEMARRALSFKPDARKVLDPSCGPATFSRSLKKAGATGLELICYDVDERMAQLTTEVNHALGLSGEVRTKDYLSDQSLSGVFDLVIMNPPYIRQEAIPQNKKDTYHQYVSKMLESDLDRRANLFVLFLLKGLVDLAPGGVLCAIVYAAITQSGYGKKTLELMDRHAELLSSRPVQAPFQEVLVDAQILLYRKREHVLPRECQQPDRADDGFVALGQLLTVRRGTGLPLRKIFLAALTDLYYDRSEPFFVKQAKLSGLVIDPDERAYLADTPHDPELKHWLRERAGAHNLEPTKVSIKGVKGPIAFNYYIRNAPRHLWNQGNVAIADNFYVSAPVGGFPAEAAWLLLNSNSYLDCLVASSRNQGNGLLKLQLYEYKQVRVPDWRRLSSREIKSLSAAAMELIDNGAVYDTVRQEANRSAEVLFNA